MIEQAIAEEAAILTGIGMGTAFALLILLMVVIVVVRHLSARILGRAAAQAAATEAEARDKALAAVIGVAALRANPKRAEPGEHDQG